MEKLIRCSGAITVSNTFLKSKFGGTIICHARDTNIFDPIKFNSDLVRKKYGVDKSKKVIMFFGTPRLHKGIEDIIKAVSLIEDYNVVLFIVGISDCDEYSDNILKCVNKTLAGRFNCFGLQSFEAVPEILSMSDIVVIPQKRNFATIGQVPAKVFDAMAMAKPIIAANVSDLPEILRDCGWMVEPENPVQLAETIQYILDNPDEANVKGLKAREKCIEKYSWTIWRKYC